MIYGHPLTRIRLQLALMRESLTQKQSAMTSAKWKK